MSRQNFSGPRAACLLLLLCAGCVTNQPWLAHKEPVPVHISQVHSNWEGRLHVTEDVVNGGRPLAGLVGRLYLMGPDLGAGQKGDGSVVVDLYDATNVHTGTKPVRLEQWQFSQNNLDKLLRKDPIGWGYTLFLPWSTYRPDINRVQLQVTYTPAKGAALYAPPAMVTLRNEGNIPIQTQKLGPQPTGQPVAARR